MQIFSTIWLQFQFVFKLPAWIMMTIFECSPKSCFWWAWTWQKHTKKVRTYAYLMQPWNTTKHNTNLKYSLVQVKWVFMLFLHACNYPLQQFRTNPWLPLHIGPLLSIVGLLFLMLNCITNATPKFTFSTLKWAIYHFLTSSA